MISSQVFMWPGRGGSASRLCSRVPSDFCRSSLGKAGKGREGRPWGGGFLLFCYGRDVDPRGAADSPGMQPPKS